MKIILHLILLQNYHKNNEYYNFLVVFLPIDEKLLLYVLPNNPIHHKHILSTRGKEAFKLSPYYNRIVTLLVKSEDAVKHINRIDFFSMTHQHRFPVGVDVGMPNISLAVV